MRRCLFLVAVCCLFVVAYDLFEWLQRASTFSSHAYTHMAGLSTIDRKITCARAMGLISLPQDEAMAARTLSYAVPRGASARRQWGALVSAAAAARRLNRALRLPRYAFNGTDSISLCQLFDVQRLPPFTNLPRFGSYDAICSRGTLPLSKALSYSLSTTVIRVPRSSDRTSTYRDLGGDWAYLRDRPSAPEADAHLCISFDDLATSHTRLVDQAAAERWLTLEEAERWLTQEAVAYSAEEERAA